jgi:hypothetical protein
MPLFALWATVIWLFILAEIYVATMLAAAEAFVALNAQRDELLTPEMLTLSEVDSLVVKDAA